MIAAKIMKKYEKWQNMTKNDKNIDIFEYDCNENHAKNGRPDGFGGWDFVRIEIFLCPTYPNKF